MSIAFLTVPPTTCTLPSSCQHVQAAVDRAEGRACSIYAKAESSSTRKSEGTSSRKALSFFGQSRFFGVHARKWSPILEEEFSTMQRRLSISCSTAVSAVSLSDLTLLSYLGDDGSINFVAEEGTRASVYAIYDKDQKLRFVGMSRDLHESLRLHLVRQPERTYFYKVLNVSKPSKALLEEIKQKWIEESGGAADDSAPWEHGIDLMKHLTAEAAADLQEAGSDEPARKKIFKDAAAPLEAAIVSALKARGATEPVRFDPQMKEKGVLDAKLTQQPNKAMPAPPKRK